MNEVTLPQGLGLVQLKPPAESGLLLLFVDIYQVQHPKNLRETVAMLEAMGYRVSYLFVTDGFSLVREVETQSEDFWKSQQPEDAR